jgi:hemerythrin
MLSVYYDRDGLYNGSRNPGPFTILAAGRADIRGSGGRSRRRRPRDFIRSPHSENLGVVSISSYSWASLLEVGIAEIDEQHRTLFRLLNELRAAADAPDAAQRQTAILAELDADTRRHFDAEEQLMRDIGFPDITAHVAEHQRLQRELDDCRAQILDRKGAIDFSAFIKSWLIGHLMTMDREYADYLNSDEE